MTDRLTMSLEFEHKLSFGAAANYFSVYVGNKFDESDI